jgi:hypothetical protein
MPCPISSRSSRRENTGRCAVLSDREREALREIERQILAEDPDLARSLQAVTPPNPHDRLWWVYTVAVNVAIAVAVVVLLMGLVVGALAFATLAGGAAVARHYHE